MMCDQMHAVKSNNRSGNESFEQPSANKPSEQNIHKIGQIYRNNVGIGEGTTHHDKTYFSHLYQNCNRNKKSYRNILYR